jgi:hypothetical protein
LVINPKPCVRPGKVAVISAAPTNTAKPLYQSRAAGLRSDMEGCEGDRIIQGLSTKRRGFGKGKWERVEHPLRLFGPNVTLESRFH